MGILQKDLVRMNWFPPTQEKQSSEDKMQEFCEAKRWTGQTYGPPDR